MESKAREDMENEYLVIIIVIQIKVKSLYWYFLCLTPLTFVSFIPHLINNPPYEIHWTMIFHLLTFYVI